MKEKIFTGNFKSICKEKNLTEEFQISNITLGHRYTISLAVHNSGGEKQKWRIVRSNPSYCRKSRRKGFSVAKFVMSPDFEAARGELRIRRNDKNIMVFREADKTQNTIIESDYNTFRVGKYALDYRLRNESIDLKTIIMNDKEVALFAVYDFKNPKIIKVVEVQGLKKKLNGLWVLPKRFAIPILKVFYVSTISHFVYVSYPPKMRAFGIGIFRIILWLSYIGIKLIVVSQMKIIGKMSLFMLTFIGSIFMGIVLYFTSQLDFFKFNINYRLNPQ